MIKVIVVDDDPTNAGLIKMLLELDGFQVTSCSDKTETEKAATIETQVFVIDCNLARGASGIDILKSIRTGLMAASETAVVIMTSGDYRLEQETMAAGANRFLLKPYSPDVLSKMISALLQNGGVSG
ncbi:MAG: response regulator [Anaerolineales bacterium]|nr:response regulator [Anaerolineales bacterium]MCA9929988.1 response regulator [Anaerolineales bacterium]